MSQQQPNLASLRTSHPACSLIRIDIIGERTMRRLPNKFSMSY
jgi:hypothetical protein